MNPKSGTRLFDTIVLLSLLLLAISRSHGQGETPAASTPAMAVIEAKLDTIRIPEVKFRATPIPKALDWLAEQSRLIDRKSHNGKGVTIFREHPRPENPALNAVLHDLTLRETLQYVSDIGKLTIKVKPDGVHVVPDDYEDPEDFIEKNYLLQPAILKALMDSHARSTNASPELSSQNRDGAKPITSGMVKHFLQDCGLLFPPGSRIDFSDPASLCLFNSPANIERFEDIARPTNLITSEVELSFSCVAFLTREIEESLRNSETLTLSQERIQTAWTAGRGRLASSFKLATICGVETRSGNIPSTDKSATDGHQFTVTARMGHDNRTIKLALDAMIPADTTSPLSGVPHARSITLPAPASAGAGHRIVTHLTCWDRQPQLIGSYPNATGTETVCVFLTTTLIDPAGKPVHSKEFHAKHRQDR